MESWLSFQVSRLEIWVFASFPQVISLVADLLVAFALSYPSVLLCSCVGLVFHHFLSRLLQCLHVPYVSSSNPGLKLQVNDLYKIQS